MYSSKKENKSIEQINSVCFIRHTNSTRPTVHDTYLNTKALSKNVKLSNNVVFITLKQLICLNKVRQPFNTIRTKYLKNKSMLDIFKELRFYWSLQYLPSIQSKFCLSVRVIFDAGQVEMLISLMHFSSFYPTLR